MADAENNRPLTCPNCRIPLNLDMEVSYAPGSPTIQVRADVRTPESLYSERGKHAMLLSVLLLYWRWCAEGRPPHGHDWPYEKGRKPIKQTWYDNDHYGMRFDPDTGTYHFNIQTSDSPEGDNWWHGEFTFDGRELRIIREGNRVQ